MNKSSFAAFASAILCFIFVLPFEARDPASFFFLGAFIFMAGVALICQAIEKSNDK